MAEELLEAEPIEAEEEPVEGQEPAEGADKLPAEGEVEQPEVTSLFDVDGKRIAKPIRDTLAKIKAENPSVGKLITDAVFRTAEFRREFPGGLTEAKEIRDKVEEFGGLSQITEDLESGRELSALAVAFDSWRSCICRGYGCL